MLSVNDISLLEKYLDFWPELTFVQRQLIIKNSNSLMFDKDQLLLGRNRTCMGLLFIKSGSLRSYIISDEGKELTLYNLESHNINILSASCVLPFIDFNVFLEANDDCEMIQIPPIVLKQLNSENKYVEAFCYKQTAKILSTSMQTMYKTIFTSLDKRLATFLISETTRLNSDTLTVTHEEIANHIGSSREAISRILKVFSSKNYISFSRKNLVVLNKKVLKSLI